MKFRRPRSALFVGLGIALCSCSSKSERVPPANSGPRPRHCQQLQKVPNSSWGPATEKRAHWNVAFSKEPSGETLGVIALDWTYWVAGDNAYAHEACIETTGVPKNVAIDPDLKVLEFVENDQRMHVQISLYATLQGPAQKDAEGISDHPQVFFGWRLASRPSGGTVEVVKSDTAFSPSWDNARIAVKGSVVAVDL